MCRKDTTDAIRWTEMFVMTPPEGCEPAWDIVLTLTGVRGNPGRAAEVIRELYEAEGRTGPRQAILDQMESPEFESYIAQKMNH